MCHAWRAARSLLLAAPARSLPQPAHCRTGCVPPHAGPAVAPSEWSSQRLHRVLGVLADAAEAHEARHGLFAGYPPPPRLLRELAECANGMIGMYNRLSVATERLEHFSAALHLRAHAALRWVGAASRRAPAAPPAPALPMAPIPAARSQAPAGAERGPLLTRCLRRLAAPPLPAAS